jgi:polyhydroxyalkanoate synthesis regulator phasin
MLTNTDVMKFLAVWELVHETADEGLRAAIARGEAVEQGEMNSDRGAFVDGLAAMVDAKKEIIKKELAAGTDSSLAKEEGPAAAAVSELRFEVAQLRGQLESMSAAIDALALAR